ncbi:MAG TPA: translation initiation factor IF-6 [Candidatus Bathyarchaeia archaeon]|nr:translation initiation factor IF-6 [Candidatus Bathyarchaeia archaeon]
MILADVFGSPNIGVYCFCTENLAVVPPGLTSRKLTQFADALGVNICNTTIGGTTLVGALVTGNSKGVLVPHTIQDYELRRIEEFSKVIIVESNWTALGNVVLANDFGAIVHPDAPTEIAKSVNKLGVQIAYGQIGSLSFVGALAIATNKGAILSPNTLNQEQSVIEAALHVKVELSTTNGGVPFVKSGILANSKGAIVGPLTRGAELMQITRALGV